MFCLGVLTHNVYSLRLLSKVISTYVLFLHLMLIMHTCLAFLHLYCSAQLSMSNIEKRCGNEINIILILFACCGHFQADLVFNAMSAS